MNVLKSTAALLALTLVAACSGGPGDAVEADPMAAADDTVFDETTAGDPMAPGAIDDSVGTQIP